MFFNGRTKNALRWVLDNLKLGSPTVESIGGFFVVLYVQSSPSIAAGIEGPIPPFFSLSSMGRPWNQVIVLCVFDEL
ncbi:universal stress protein PHOS34 [Fagus crenata]